MHKGTLVDILFQNAQCVPRQPRRTKVEKVEESSRKQFENVFCKAQSTSRGSNIIKITQFNSSLIIGDEKLLRRGGPLSSSASPQKNFAIKKVGDLKSKVVVTAQKIIEMELRKKDKNNHFHLSNHSFANDGAKPIEKILVTTRCAIKKEAANIESLTSGISIDGDILLMDKSIDQSLTRFISDQRRQLKKSKEALSITTKPPCFHPPNGSEKKIEFNDMCQLQMVSRKNTGSPRRHYTRHIHEQKKYQEMIEKEKREILQIKRELNKNYAKPFNPPDNITAHSYIVYQADAQKSKLLRKLSLKRDDSPEAGETRKSLLNSYKVIVGSNSRSAVEIASLTKIMTCILTLDLAKRYSVDLKQQLVTIGIFEQNIGGTSANIQKGEVYSVEQLLYGLMLPSGNDASLALAVWGGKLLLQKELARKEALSSTASSETTLSSFKKKDCYDRFVMEMNAKAVELNMEKTKYANSHGLSNSENKSCPFDLALLCEYAMNNRQFRDIVSCKVYEAVISIENEETVKPIISFQNSSAEKDGEQSEDGMMESEEMKDLEEVTESYNEEQIAEEKNKYTGLVKTVRWENTHQLLQSKPGLYVGIKTGITTTAGPCLSSCVQICGKRFIIIVLNCKSMKYRFKDTENLRKWLFNKEEIKYKEEGKPIDKLDLAINSQIHLEPHQVLLSSP